MLWIVIHISDLKNTFEIDDEKSDIYREHDIHSFDAGDLLIDPSRILQLISTALSLYFANTACWHNLAAETKQWKPNRIYHFVNI